MNRLSRLLVWMSVLLMGQGVLGDPLQFGATARFLQRLKESKENPIDLYRSLGVAPVPHAGKLFTVRTLLRLDGPELPSAYEQKSIRNEICSSMRMYAAPIPHRERYGSMGVYLLDGSIVSVADNGLMGERLDSVLRKLQTLPLVQKQGIAKHYIRAIWDALDAIHALATALLVNNVSLSNFYVRPDGELSMIDFSEARNTNAVLGFTIAKEENLTMTSTIPEVYKLLFPGVQALREYATAGIGANPQVAVAGGRGAAVAAVAAFPPLVPVPYVPANNSNMLDDLPAPAIAGWNTNILVADHDISAAAGAIAAFVNPASNGGATGFGLQPGVRDLIIDPATGAAFAGGADICIGWTGN